MIKNNDYHYNKKIKKVIWNGSKNKPLKRNQLQVNHNLSEIRQLFNPPTDRMGNRRKQEEGWGGGGLG